jgi:hypothetical protein
MDAAICKLRRCLVLSAALMGVVLSVGTLGSEASIRHQRRVQSPTCAWHQAGLSRQPAQGGGASQPPPPLIHTAASSFAYSHDETDDVRLILKTHRLAWVPVPVRRLKLPSSQSDPL